MSRIDFLLHYLLLIVFINDLGEKNVNETICYRKFSAFAWLLSSGVRRRFSECLYAIYVEFQPIWDQAHSASEAASRLNDAKLETPKGAKWYPATVLSFAAVAGLI